MSLTNYGVEQGYDIYAENGDEPLVSQLAGAAAPGGDAGPQDAANVGSIYQRTDGKFYKKETDTNSTADWIEVITNVDLTQLSFRSELVRVTTGDAVSAGSRDLVGAPFTDDDGTKIVAADFAVGEYVLSGIGGTPKLFEVTAISAPSVTFTEETTNVLADNDAFLSRNHLPDSPNDQEEQAFVMYNGTDVLKLGDVNWEFATGINLSSGYSGTGNGTVSSSDTVESAIQKLDANQKDLTTLSGVAQGAVDLGTGFSSCIADNRNNKEAFEDLIVCIETLSNAKQTAGFSIPTHHDVVLVDDVLATEWECHVFEDATPANIKVFKVWATHNGTASADATTTDHTNNAKLKQGGNFNLDVSMQLIGAGASQEMRMLVDTTEAGLTITTRRTDVIAP